MTEHHDHPRPDQPRDHQAPTQGHTPGPLERPREASVDDQREEPTGPPAEQLLTAQEAADLLDVDLEELARMRAEGIGPEWGELVRRHVRYDRRDLETYRATRTSHSDHHSDHHSDQGSGQGHHGEESQR